MTGLNATISLLRHQRREAAPRRSGGCNFQEVPGFGGNPGNLKMLTHRPARLPGAAPLVVVLHGCTQNAEAYAAASGWVTLADQCGFALLTPEQSSANNQNRCFNWFLPGDTQRGKGEAASIAEMIDCAVGTYSLDRRRVFITGLSAGGAMTTAMLASYPELFAAGAVIAGLPYGVACNVGEAMSAMHRPHLRPVREMGDLVKAAAPRPARQPRLSVWHGDADWTVNISNGVAITDQWVAAGGLTPEPDRVVQHPGFRRLEWRSPGSGEVSVEFNVVPGLGHGTPVSSKGPNGLGTPGPYVIEAAISSTLEIAAFWGIAPSPGDATATSHAEGFESAAQDQPGAPTQRPRPGADVVAAVSSHVPPKVADVISKALRSAGLMG